MKKHKGGIRGFYWTSKAWYFTSMTLLHDAKDEIMFGIFHKEHDGDYGTTGEMAMRWYLVGKNIIPKLEIYDDAFSALSTFGDLIKELGTRDNENITPEEFYEILLNFGFKDLTKKESPYEKK